MTSIKPEIRNARFIDAVAAYLRAEGLDVSAREQKRFKKVSEALEDDVTPEHSDLTGLKHFAVVANAMRKFMPGHWVPLASGAARLDGKPWGIYVVQAPEAPLSGSHVVMSLATFAEVATRLEAMER
ncbi:hypothetical protein [Rathayibacter sp. AY1H2]|uniref:hypothetical protein n=1 Tax=Rathayibacter sp. AY1H2 TaxID=2080566 RepID=UPI0011AFEE1E|nr:hypothetical protein [Rathayibacter sp. AY1H2]